MDIGHIRALQAGAQGLHDLRLGDAEQRRLLPVDVDDEAWRRRLVAVIHVDDVGRRVEQLADILRKLALLGVARPVNLGHDRCAHRRSRRHFDDLHGGAVVASDGGERRPDGERDVMALAAAVALVDQIDLDVAEARVLPQIVLAHEAIEVDRRGGAGVGLVIADLGNSLDDM